MTETLWKELFGQKLELLGVDLPPEELEAAAQRLYQARGDDNPVEVAEEEARLRQSTVPTVPGCD